MSATRFESASGLRLAAAFLLIIAVLGVVALKAFKLAFVDAGEQPRNLKEQRSPEIGFDLVDKNGVPLALSIERMELVAYPNALWQAHTPDQLLPVLARTLGWKTEELSEALLPPLVQGWFEITAEPFQLDAVQGQALSNWIARGSNDPAAVANPVAGFELRREGALGPWRLRWQPIVALSRATRERHGANSTVRWTRRIADDLIQCVFGAQGKKELESNEHELNAARAMIWDALLPLHFKRVLKEVPPETAMRVYQLLKTESVRDHQMRLLPVNKRVYPVREGAESDEQPLAVLGAWGMLPGEEARERARKELHLEDDQALEPEDQTELEARELLRRSYPSPVCGLELLGYRTLQQPEYAWIQRDPERYYFLASYVPRRAPMRYFQADEPGSAVPRLVTTLDAGLQRHMRSALEQVMEKHKPAVAMAIAIEVATGKVLAVDSLDAYEASGFQPTVHTFTPGSTMKVIVMSTAVDTGVIDLDEKIDTFEGHFVLDGKRKISEAEGKHTGKFTPAEGLAYSCNAVLVQIGLRIPAAELYTRLKRLHYAHYPEAGLGSESCGRLPPWPWTRVWSHASVCFGHELMVTLWQHAAALATVVRGGNYLPLRLFEAVEQGTRHEALPEPGPGERIFKPETCATVRSMMQLGAREGTGRAVYCDELVMGTKTGTAQKVGGEVCLHTEMAYQRELAQGGPHRTRQELKGLKSHGGPCYTSSMCAWGHLPDSTREVMVLLVVDEPRGGSHYGSEVAGPATISILKEALGYTHGGVRVNEAPKSGFAPLEIQFGKPGAAAKQDSFGVRLRALPEQPWREVGRALR